jgi:glycosyltransferase involved in cell wall biosynthesis
LPRWTLLSDDFPPLIGGVSTVAWELSIGLRDHGFDVTVLTRRRDGIPGLGGVDIRPISGPSFRRFGGWWARWHASDVLAPSHRLFALQWTMARSLRRGFDLMLHGSDVETMSPAMRKTMARAANCWVMSAYLRDRLLDAGVIAKVIPAPIDAALPGRPARNPLRWICLSRAEQFKGADRFVRLVAAAGVRGTFVGDGSQLQQLKELAAKTDAKIDFVGALSRADIWGLFSEHDLCVQLSRREGFGLSVLEAASHGVPVMVSRAGGLPEAAGPGLVLNDADNAEQSLLALHRWWKPSRGLQAHAWVSARHGRRRTVSALLRPQ